MNNFPSKIRNDIDDNSIISYNEEILLASLDENIEEKDNLFSKDNYNYYEINWNLLEEEDKD